MAELFQVPAKVLAAEATGANYEYICHSEIAKEMRPKTAPITPKTIAQIAIFSSRIHNPQLLHVGEIVPARIVFERAGFPGVDQFVDRIIDALIRLKY